MTLAWTIWGCLMVIFGAIIILGNVFDKLRLAYIGATGLILGLAALFILTIIGSYLGSYLDTISNGNI